MNTAQTVKRRYEDRALQQRKNSFFLFFKHNHNYSIVRDTCVAHPKVDLLETKPRRRPTHLVSEHPVQFRPVRLAVRKRRHQLKPHRLRAPHWRVSGEGIDALYHHHVIHEVPQLNEGNEHHENWPMGAVVVEEVHLMWLKMSSLRQGKDGFKKHR